jgi:hypothetical protein
MGRTFGDDDLVGVKFDARKFAKEFSLRRPAFTGDDGAVAEPIRRLPIDAVND